MRNYTTMFPLLFSASMSGGTVLKNIFEYLMLIALGLAIVFLLCERKKIRKSERGKEISTIYSWTKAIAILIVGFAGAWIILKIPNLF